MTAKRLLVSEIFYSLQGESRTSGIPTVFVRLSGCPLRCGYCDTQYAFSGGELLSVEEIMHRVNTYRCAHVCVTGGEPLAQKATPGLLQRLADEGVKVSLETGGMLDISQVPAGISRVVDLKTPGSGETDKNRWENLAELTPDDQIKFVICSRNDYDWAKGQIEKRRLDSRCEVLFSPAVEQQNPRQLAEWILEDRLPVRFQLQLHKQLWGNERAR